MRLLGDAILHHPNSREYFMTAFELYEALNKSGIDFELIEIFDGSRLLRFEIDDSEIEEGEGDSFTTKEVTA